MKRINLILVAALMVLGSAIYAYSVPNIGSGTILYGQFNPAASPTLKPGGSYPIRIDSKGALILSGGGGSGDVAMGGVVVGDSASTVFNSADTAGNTMNNAFTINNASGNNSAFDLTLSDLADGGEYLSLCGNFADCRSAPIAWFEAFPGSTSDTTQGMEVDFGTTDTSNASSLQTAIECDSALYSGSSAKLPTIPNFCRTAVTGPAGGGGFAISANDVLLFLESPAPTGVALGAFIWNDLSTHRLKMNNNNGGATNIVGLSDLATSAASGAAGSLFASGTISATDSATVGCTDTDATVASVTTAMTCHASPQGAPAGAGSGNIIWGCYTIAGHVKLRVCTIAVVTAAATTYNYEVFN